MIVTNERIVVVPAPLSGSHRLLRALQRYVSFGQVRTARGYQVPLLRIRRIWKWEPELSAPVFLQTTDESGVTYRLIENRFPRAHALPISAQREHIEVVEAAVAAAIARRGPLPGASE